MAIAVWPDVGWPRQPVLQIPTHHHHKSIKLQTPRAPRGAWTAYMKVQQARYFTHSTRGSSTVRGPPCTVRPYCRRKGIGATLADLIPPPGTGRPRFSKSVVRLWSEDLFVKSEDLFVNHRHLSGTWSGLWHRTHFRLYRTILRFAPLAANPKSRAAKGKATVFITRRPKI